MDKIAKNGAGFSASRWAVRASELTGCTDATELQKIIAKKGQQPSYLLQPLYRQKVGRQP